MRFSWEELVCLSNIQLDKIDVAVANLVCAAGLPGCQRVDVVALCKKLDEWATLAKRTTKQLYSAYEARPGDFNHSKSRFRITAMIEVLQRDLGIRYDARLIERDDFFVDASNVFIHGPILGRRGTCTSLPPLYLAIGRRLGYPLKLVRTKSHLFVRWDDGNERFNIECTSLGFVSHPDEHYLSWPVPCTHAEVREFALLKRMTPKEELACFMAARGHCLLDNGLFREAGEAYAWAYELEPTCRLHLSSMQACSNRWKMRLREKWQHRQFPPVTLQVGTRRFSVLPCEDEADWAYLCKIEDWIGSALASTMPVRDNLPKGPSYSFTETGTQEWPLPPCVVVESPPVVSGGYTEAGRALLEKAHKSIADYHDEGDSHV